MATKSFHETLLSVCPAQQTTSFQLDIRHFMMMIARFYSRTYRHDPLQGAGPVCFMCHTTHLLCLSQARTDA